MAFLEDYKAHVAERATQGIPPFPLTKEQVTDLVQLITADQSKNSELIEMLSERVNPGVDDAAHVKAAFLHEVVQGKQKAFLADASDINSDDHKKAAIKILGKMVGGYNVKPLIDALSIESLAADAANELKHTLLVYDAFNDIVELSKTNSYAKEVLASWANAEWFTSKPVMAEKFSVVVFKFPGETNTDDLSPASEAFTRSDIPLHAVRRSYSPCRRYISGASPPWAVPCHSRRDAESPRLRHIARLRFSPRFFPFCHRDGQGIPSCHSQQIHHLHQSNLRCL